MRFMVAFEKRYLLQSYSLMYVNYIIVTYNKEAIILSIADCRS